MLLLLFVVAVGLTMSCKEEVEDLLVTPKPRPEPVIPIDPDPDPDPVLSVPYVKASTFMQFMSSADVVIDAPADIEEGDLLIAVMAKNGSTASTPPADKGWLRFVNQRYGSGTPLARAWWKKATADEPATYTFNSGSTSQSGRMDMYLIKNWNGSAPIALSSSGPSSATNIVTPDILPISSKDDLLISVGSLAAVTGMSGITWTMPAGMTKVTDLSGEAVILAAASLTLTDNTNSSRQFTIAGTATSRAGLGVSIIVPATATRPVVKIYHGGAAKNEYLPQGAMQAFLSHPTIRFDVRSIGENEVEKLTAENLAEADYYVQPGGPTIQAGWPFVEAQKAIVKDYVEGGGKYLGFCLGAYFGRNAVNAGYELLAEGVFAYRYTNVAGTNPPAAGDYEIATTAYIKLDWRNQATRNVMIADGAYFTSGAEAIPGVEILARYNHTGQIAALTFPKGEGMVSLVGPHPESMNDWLPSGIDNPDGNDLDHDLVHDMINSMNE